MGDETSEADARLAIAFKQGFEHYSQAGGVTHKANGDHLSPYAKRGDPELLRAWLEGFQHAREKAMS